MAQFRLFYFSVHRVVNVFLILVLFFDLERIWMRKKMLTLVSSINVVDQTIGSLQPLLPALRNPKSNKAKPVVESNIRPISKSEAMRHLITSD